jgi:hypothetical protein
MSYHKAKPSVQLEFVHAFFDPASGSIFGMLANESHYEEYISESSFVFLARSIGHLRDEYELGYSKY